MATAMPLLAACDLLDGKPPTPPAPDALADFYAQTMALVALYDVAVSGAPQLASIRDAHRAHAAALAGIMRPAPSAQPSGAASAPASATPAELRQAEQLGYQKAMEVGLTAPGPRATLLGEITAARACHLEVLP
ncbi:MAG TPA: hypothetical protein DGT23_16600 [Micromonosporaceae bacterium]|nr:hypothetical protein [Micromonosporaceae bacterium]